MFDAEVLKARHLDCLGELGRQQGGGFQAICGWFRAASAEGDGCVARAVSVT
ncbi:hypothetical protein [Streptomyces sasae]|uniref:hypothetical protein n=1 Tax=Streptomyces sasae TaxID=1266772 RepID=UPI0029308526|nr:hypothetical protein [Streptomyces sasae]